MVTFEDITKENYCEYQTFPSGRWHPSKFASSVVGQHLISIKPSSLSIYICKNFIEASKLSLE